MTETRWLDAAEQRTWRAYLAATQLLTDQLDRELQRDAGMPHGYYEVLVRLSEAPGRTLRMSELAMASLSSRSRLSHAVARLEEAGWVRRQSCPTDRRGAFAVLTDLGFAKLEEAAPGHVEGVRTHLFDQLSPTQVRQLGQISETLRAHLTVVRGGPALAPADTLTCPPGSRSHRQLRDRPDQQQRDGRLASLGVAGPGQPVTPGRAPTGGAT